MGEVLARPDTTTDSSWFLFDEVSESGKHEILIPLAKKGRSKGAKIFLAFQSIASLQSSELYGMQGTDDLLGQIATKFIGRLECPTTAEYFSRLLGDKRKMQASYSYTSGGDKPTSTVSYSEQTRRNVLPSSLTSLPFAGYSNGIVGYVMSPRFGAFKTKIPGKKLFDQDLIPPKSDVQGFIARPAHQQILRPWTEEEAARFGVDIHRPMELKGFSKSIDGPKRNPQPKLTFDPLEGMFE